MSAAPSQDDRDVTEWELGTWLLHRETPAIYELLDPEDRDFLPLLWLGRFGIDDSWGRRVQMVGGVRITHLTA
jgi:hypothetical protein